MTYLRLVTLPHSFPSLRRSLAVARTFFLRMERREKISAERRRQRGIVTQGDVQLREVGRHAAEHPVWRAVHRECVAVYEITHRHQPLADCGAIRAVRCRTMPRHANAFAAQECGHISLASCPRKLWREQLYKIGTLASICTVDVGAEVTL